jgi:hypothetical protein
VDGRPKDGQDDMGRDLSCDQVPARPVMPRKG